MILRRSRRAQLRLVGPAATTALLSAACAAVRRLAARPGRRGRLLDSLEANGSGLLPNAIAELVDDKFLQLLGRVLRASQNPPPILTNSDTEIVAAINDKRVADQRRQRGVQWSAPAIGGCIRSPSVP
jgi:hypothetical protein